MDSSTVMVRRFCTKTTTVTEVKGGGWGLFGNQTLAIFSLLGEDGQVQVLHGFGGLDADGAVGAVEEGAG